VICDADACARAGWTVPDYASACLDSGATFLQIRAKSASSTSLLAWAEAVVRRAEGSGAVIVVNDRADIARIAAAGGVHVGQDDLAPAAVRTVVGEHARIGLSTHTPEQMRAAILEPVDYVAIGPVFGTTTKVTGHGVVGLAGVSEAVRVAGGRRVPVVAIGGITLDTAADVIGAGAAAVAVIADLLSTGDPAVRVRAYLDRL
jgi:thiamine-phosphate pyrophosphorylase